MNKKQMQLEKDLSTIRVKLKDLDVYKQTLLTEESEVKRELETLYALNSPKLSAVNLWCKITNALIAKYKTMSEVNPEEAVRQLLMLQGALIGGGFLTKEELDKGL